MIFSSQILTIYSKLFSSIPRLSLSVDLCHPHSVSLPRLSVLFSFQFFNPPLFGSLLFFSPWCCRLNPGPRACKTEALLLSYSSAFWILVTSLIISSSAHT